MALEDGLISVWQMNGDWLDVIDDNPATPYGCTFDTTTKKLGASSGRFANGPYLRIDDSPSYKLNVMTWGFWLYPRSATSHDKFISLDYRANGSWSNPYTAYSIGSYSNGYNIEWAVAGNKQQLTSSLAGLVWHFVIVEWNGTTVTLYEDNGYKTSRPQGGAIDYGTSKDMTFGTRSPYTPGDQFNGNLDEVALWNRVLTPAERTELWNGGAGIELVDVDGAGRRRRMMIA